MLVKNVGKMLVADLPDYAKIGSKVNLVMKKRH